MTKTRSDSSSIDFDSTELNDLSKLRNNHISYGLIQQSLHIAPNINEITSKKTQDDKIALINQRIKSLRKSQFNRSDKHETVLIKEVSDTEDTLPINPIVEAEIQALRYLKGMLIIGRSGNITDTHYSQTVFRAFKAYNDSPKSGKDLHIMAEAFALLLAETLKISDESARKQVTMARDLGSMLEEQPAICTISTTSKEVTIELSINAKLSQEYYQENLALVDSDDKSKPAKWFTSALAFAGMKGQKDTWLESFFKDQDPQSQHSLSHYRHSAPPSARWLPLPGNMQDVVTYTAELNNSHRIKPETAKTTKFTRYGTVPYDISDIEEQKRLTENMLVEAFSERIVKDYIAYCKKYGKLADTKFYVNYETLLSPHYIEENFYEGIKGKFRHKDNNAAFVSMTKEALQRAASTIQNKVTKSIRNHRFEGEDIGVPTLIFSHTNSAVNSWADIPNTHIKSPLIKVFDEDVENRKGKINSVAALLTSINEHCPHDISVNALSKFFNDKNKIAISINELQEHLEKVKTLLQVNKNKLGISDQTINLMIQRINAAAHLRMLMSNATPYDKLPNYQRNIMQAALESMVVGDQATTLKGCKSARDRTAIVSAASKTMQENPEAMHDWKLVDKGIVVSLVQGHHFRAMGHHVAVVKASDVHSHFTRVLPKALVSYIKEFKAFSKKLDEKPMPDLNISEKRAQKICEQITAKLEAFSKKHPNAAQWGGGEANKIFGHHKKLPSNINRIHKEYLKAFKAKENDPYNKHSYKEALQNIQAILDKTTSNFHKVFAFGRAKETQDLYNKLSDIAYGKTKAHANDHQPSDKAKLTL